MVKNIISIFIGSKNPTKINAVKKAFTSVFKKKHFSFVSVSSPSGVGDQPMSERETKRGAENRLFYLKENFKVLHSAVMGAKPNSFKGTFLNSISISSTLGPGIKIGVE